MAITGAILDSGPTQQRQHILDQSVVVHNAEPGGTYIEVKDSVPTLIRVEPPSQQGQVYFYRRSDGKNRAATMYVGVDVDGVLTWIAVSTGTPVNGYTGRPTDPIYD